MYIYTHVHCIYKKARNNKSRGNKKIRKTANQTFFNNVSDCFLLIRLQANSLTIIYLFFKNKQRLSKQQNAPKSCHIVK